MGQQVYNVGVQGTNDIVSVLNPFAVVDYNAYMNNQVDALEYTNSADAASVANYLNGLNLNMSFVVLRPHPKPR